MREESSCGGEYLRLPASGADQQFQRFADGDVIIDDKYHRPGMRHRQRPNRMTNCGRIHLALPETWMQRTAQLIRRAAFSALSNAVSLKGLNRHSTAPCCRTLER